MKPSKAPLKHLEKKVSSLKVETKSIQKISEELIGKYVEQESVVRKTVWKPFEMVSTLFVGMVMYIRIAITKRG